jgi:hypothetical protein
MVLKLNLVVLENDLKKIVETIQEIKNSNLDSNTIQSVQVMANELDKVFHAIAEPLIPFYKMLDSEVEFQNNFHSEFSKFTARPADNAARNLGYHCRTVYESIESLLNKDEWLRSFPNIKNRLEGLKTASYRWILYDSVVGHMMYEFYLDLNYGLSRVEESMKVYPIKESWETLKSFLSESERSFDSIIEQHNNMPYVTDKLQKK